MTKLDILRLDSTTENDTAATLNINTNFENIQKAIENTLSRDGTTPNYMDADLDMNSYRIINVGEAVDDTDAVSYKQFKEEIGEASIAASQAAASAAQAASSAQSALVSSTNAINSVRGAENVLSYTQNLLSETQEYVDTAKADIAETASTNEASINKTVADAKQEINTAIDEAEMSLSDTIIQATEDVKQQALDAAQGAINSAAAEATAIVVDYTNNEIKPLLNEIASNAAESAENASESAGLAASESSNAAISATDSQHYAEDSRIWAEGSDSEVKNVDGEHSSKVWSEMTKTSATSAASSAELAKQYGNDKINQTHITNCITEIPQDIKLELVDGVLTLKAGSKVYIPNGSGVFDVITIARDITRTISANDKYMIFVQENGTAMSYRRVSTQTASGTTTPISEYWAYYNTTDNKIYQIDNGVNSLQLSLPVCVVTVSSGAISSIDQVFNGFGYIGLTVFALPGVKGLIPNGRNADGTLKNIEFETSNVLTANFSGDGNRVLAILSSVVGGNAYLKYDEVKNIVYNSNTGVILQNCLWGSLYISSNKITSLQPKLPFRAVDQNDFNKLDEEAVKTSGDQIIGGVKTIDAGSTVSLQIKSNIIDNSVTPETDQFSNCIDMLDKNNIRIGRIFQRKRVDGTNGIFLQARGIGDTNYILGINSDSSTEAPTPPVSDNSTQIATTAWFRNNMQVVTALPSSPTSGVFYFVKE